MTDNRAEVDRGSPQELQNGGVSQPGSIAILNKSGKNFKNVKAKKASSSE
jgi:hypothetical protein